MKIVAICGEAGSGKDTVARILEKRLASASTVSLGRLVRSDLHNMGVAPDRKLQARVADHRRTTRGAGYWVDQGIRSASAAHLHVILTGLYAAGEVQHLHSLGGIAVWIEADRELRLERILNRMDGARDEQILSDREGFLAQLEHEKGSQQKALDQVSLLSVRPLCNFSLSNNVGLDELEAAAADLIDLIEKHNPSRLDNLSLIAAPEFLRYDAETPWSESLDFLTSLERRHFFEAVLASSDVIAVGDLPSVQIGMSLRDSVRALYKPNLRSITGNQTARRMAEIFEEENPDTALTKIRAFKPSNQEEEYFTGLTDSEFHDLHLQTHIRWAKSRFDIIAVIPEKLERIKKIDRQQFEVKKNRGIERLRRDGVVISIMPKHIEAVVAWANNPICRVRPVLEFVKSDRIFQVSGFTDAKASLVVHDVIDHMWTFDLIDRIGLFHKYHQMFDATGNPEKVDIFRREGEAVASISYGVRAFEGIAPGFRPLIGAKDIVRMIREMRGGRLSEVHTDALRIINNLESDGTEWKSLAYTFSNYITELDEQRRVYGCIKYRDPSTHRVVGELDPYSPDYLSFFVEAHHALLDSANKHRNALFFTHFVIEEYLRNVATTRTPGSPISITPALLDGTRLRHSSSVPTEVSGWMFRNYGFTANRNAL